MANIDMSAPPLSQTGSGETALYHYTNFFGLTGIASSKAIWCSQIQYLNDTSELRHGMEILASVCTNHFGEHSVSSNIKDRTQAFRGVNVFVCSFSEAHDLLSQWRGYSAGSGVSIEFSFKNLSSRAMASGFTLAKCVYSNAEKISITREFVQQQLSGQSPNFDDGRETNRLVANFLPVAARFKHESFIEEQEWRLISPPVSSFSNQMKVRATSTGLVPYVEFDLRTGEQPLKSESQPWRTNEDICVRSVMIGPNREQELQMSAVGTLFDTHKVYVRSVGRSGIPFRLL